ncbi:MAG: cadherin repeat domain-containing protein [Bdellovibrionales bacterium]|nr:cadherin repeat domain-containing protein [Bdellovibrionales bacterium]
MGPLLRHVFSQLSLSLGKPRGLSLFFVWVTLSTSGCFKNLGDEALRNGSLGIDIIPASSQETKKIINARTWTEIQARITAPNEGSELNGIPIRFTKTSPLSGREKDDDAVIDCNGTEATSCEFSTTSAPDQSGVITFRVRAASNSTVKSQFQATIPGSSNPLRFTIDVNESPTSIQLDGSSVPENSATGTIAGTLETIDPDDDDRFTYRLVDSESFPDNSALEISGSKLKLKKSADFETKKPTTLASEPLILKASLSTKQ